MWQLRTRRGRHGTAEKRSTIRLQEQPFRILAALVDRPGEVVSREDLKARIWANDTFVDFDRSLNKAVNRLREVLNDDASHPRYIETVPRRGYRFVAHVMASAAPLGTVLRRRPLQTAGSLEAILTEETVAEDFV
ncbi:MAG: helix-turn-helix domain-containing protein [Bryobacteraceae bacterium]